MSNATVSSQVYVIRNAGALAAVDAGTMILYADGSDVFAKDASGTVYNLTSASAVSVAFNDLTDVSVSGATSTQILQYNGTNWVAVDVFDLGELGDVSVSGATNGQVLQYNGTSWVAVTPSSGGATTLDGLTDVDTSGVANGDVLVYNSTSTNWEVGQAMQTFSITDGNNSFAVSNSDTTRFTAGTGLHSISTPATKQIQYSLSANASDLGDVTYSSQTAGQVLQWSGSAWTNSDLSVFELSNVDQNGVTLSAAAGAGKVLAWDQTEEAFVPVDQSGGGSGLQNVVEDTTPQLGGNLDAQDNDIQMGTGEINFAADGAEKIHSSGSAFVFTVNNNTELSLSPTSLSPGANQGLSLGVAASSFSAAYATDFYATVDTSKKIGILSPAAGDVSASFDLTLPTSAGSSGQYLQTDGSGVLSWASASGYSPESFVVTQHKMTIIKKTIPDGSSVSHNINLLNEAWWHTVTGDSSISGSTDKITLNAVLPFPVRSTMDTDGTNAGIIKFQCSGVITSNIPISIQGRLRDPKNDGSTYNGTATVSGNMVFSNSTLGSFNLTTADISDITAKQIMTDNSLTSLDGLEYELIIVFGGTPSTAVTNKSFTVAEVTIPMEM